MLRTRPLGTAASAGRPNSRLCVGLASTDSRPRARAYRARAWLARERAPLRLGEERSPPTPRGTKICSHSNSVDGCVHTKLCVRMCICVAASECMSVCMTVSAFMCVYITVSACLYICVALGARVYIYIYIYMYVYTRSCE